LRVAFFGTSDFAVPVLERIAGSGHTVNPVVTSAPKPSGRGRKLLPAPVEDAAVGLGLAVSRPADPHAPESVELLRAAEPDVGILVAYGHILRQRLLDIPRLGFYNLHPSLLPLYRGAAPIQRTLMDGRTRTGVTVIAMSRAVDAGDIVAQSETDVRADETYGELSSRLAQMGADLVVETLRRIETGTLTRIAQDPTRATPAPKLAKNERTIDWSQLASVIHNRIRAMSPEPGAVTALRGKRLFLLRSRVSLADATEEPGTLLGSSGLIVAAGKGAVELLDVQPESGKVQSGKAFRNGHRLMPGERFTSP